VGLAAALAGALLVAGPAAGSGARTANVSWPSANGNVASQRAATATELDAQAIPRLRVRWRFRLHSSVTSFGAIASTPIIRGDVAYVQDSSSSVYALDIRSGSRRLVSRFEQFIAIAPVVDRGRVYVSTQGFLPQGRGALSALSAATGRIVWRFQTVKLRGGIPLPAAATAPGIR
jgi:glucose dehydrogenase